MRFVRLRNAFLTGLVVLLPSILTIYILLLLLRLVDNLLGRFLVPLIGKSIPGLGVIITTILIFLTGFLATNIIGQSLLRKSEEFFLSIPIVGTTYRSIKQIITSFSKQKPIDFHRLVLVQYPRKGVYSVAFVFGETQGEIRAKSDIDLFNVYLPTTPNPTMGYLLIVPKKDAIPLPLSIEEGLKLVISGGIYSPAVKSR